MKQKTGNKQKIRELKTKYNVTVEEIAKAFGRSYAHTSMLISGTRDVSDDIYQQLENAVVKAGLGKK